MGGDNLFLLALLGIGLLVGALALLLVPRRKPSGTIATWLLGLAGSLVGGTLGYTPLGTDLEEGFAQTSGYLSSVVGSTVLLLIYNVASRRKVSN